MTDNPKSIVMPAGPMDFFVSHVNQISDGFPTPELLPHLEIAYVRWGREMVCRCILLTITYNPSFFFAEGIIVRPVSYIIRNAVSKTFPSEYTGLVKPILQSLPSTNISNLWLWMVNKYMTEGNQ